MSRVDFVVDGEKVAEAHPHLMDRGDVRLSFDGGETFPLASSRWEHIVVDVETRPPEDRMEADE